MSEYHLQARRAVDGPGSRREQTRLLDADSVDAAERIAGELAVDGYTVWIFRRIASHGVSAVTHRLRLLRTVRPAQEPDHADSTPLQRRR